MGCSGCNTGVLKHYTRNGSNAPSITDNFPLIDLSWRWQFCNWVAENVYTKVVKTSMCSLNICVPQLSNMPYHCRLLHRLAGHYSRPITQQPSKKWDSPLYVILPFQTYQLWSNGRPHNLCQNDVSGFSWFLHKNSSPDYLQNNGKVETTVKSMKKLIC